MVRLSRKPFIRIKKEKKKEKEKDEEDYSGSLDGDTD